MKSKIKIPLIFLAVLAVAVFIILERPETDSGANNLTGNISGNSATEKTGANQDVPMASNGEPIQIAFTDDNSGENLIIATDKQIYNGFSNSEVHISLTNKDSIDHNGQLLFYFPAKDDTKIKLPATVKKLQVYQAGKWQSVGISTAAVNANDPALKDALAKKKEIPENMTFKGAADFSAKSGETVYFKAEIVYPPGGVGEFFIEGIADRGGYGLLDPYYSSTYAYRRPLIINKNKVSTVSGTTLSNFPVLVNITNSDLKASASGGYVQRVTGNDILFTDSTGSNKLSYELESYNGTTGNVVAWVKIASLSPSFDTTMYMYYNNPTATDQSAATAVWDANYKGVWHSKDTTTTTIADSTSGANTGTKTGVGEPVEADGKIGKAQSYDGIDDIVSMSADVGPISNGTFTITAWIKRTQLNKRDGIISSNISTYVGFAVHEDNTLRLAKETDTWIGQSTDTIPAGSWKNVGVTYDGSNWKLYIDGVLNGSGVSANTFTSWNTKLGVYYANIFKGLIDEVRISNSVRSADWIKTEYNNQSDPNTFVGMNAPQTPTRTAPSVNIKGGVKIRGGVQFH